ncbi:MAG: serine hydrolase [Alphaproteobacteria bacterium]|nr:serine hydrolase [Alphaproteobacteria bacterium]
MINTQGLDARLKRACDDGAVPGVIAAVATVDGPIYEGAFGTRDLATGTPMTTDTIVWIASMTKAVTGAAAMQLVERGTLALDEPMARVMPELGELKVLEGFAADGTPRLREPKSPITLRHLLTHTSGLVYEFWNADLLRYMEKTGLPSLAGGKIAGLQAPLAFDPGTKWEYGISIEWLGKIIEKATGRTLGEYLADEIFRPLGMAETGFKLSPAQEARLAKVHARTPEGLVPTDFRPAPDAEFESGGSALYSTVGDYLRFTQMLLQGGALGGKRILRPETVALMGQNAMGDIDTRALKSAVPTLSTDVSFIEGMKWGLSFMINPAPLATGRSAGSLSWAGLANSYYWIDPAKGVTGVFATQILPFNDAEAFHLFEAFEEAVYAAL